MAYERLFKAAENLSTYVYDPTSYLRVSETVPAGVRYSLLYDQTLWLPTVSQDGLGNRTTLQYDAFGNLTTSTDANGKITTFGYAGTGSTRHRIRQTDPLGRVTSYAYTTDGLLQTYTDPRGLYYAHCTMCCILSRSYGERCANVSQTQQIVRNKQNNDKFKDINNGRWHGCNKGKAIARDHTQDSMPCAVACLQKGVGFPWPTGGNNRPFPFGETCADYLRHPTPFADPNPGPCFMGTPLRRPCPNV